ncbi:MAG TPA: Asp23/Gls24 family envelope stress response protein [Thermoleophilia bacterium]|nr:Asp23/Gls24 family envelope stress response protein [Thermoleophilia bacterium]
MAQSDLKAQLPTDDLAGEVVVADTVIAKLAARAALRTYGVVDLRSSVVGFVVGTLGRLLGDPYTGGVEVDAHEEHADIVLHVIIERGLNLAEVKRTLEEQVRFEVERVAGVRVGRVGVRVEDLRQ